MYLGSQRKPEKLVNSSFQRFTGNMRSAIVTRNICRKPHSETVHELLSRSSILDDRTAEEILRGILRERPLIKPVMDFRARTEVILIPIMNRNPCRKSRRRCDSGTGNNPCFQKITSVHKTPPLSVVNIPLYGQGTVRIQFLGDCKRYRITYPLDFEFGFQFQLAGVPVHACRKGLAQATFFRTSVMSHAP